MSQSLYKVLIKKNLFRRFIKESRRLISQQNYASDGEKETHFGFEKVTEGEKDQKVYELFANVAANYDRMNDAMSLGIHRFWKDYFMGKLSPTNNTNLLDVAGGTGDIAFRFLDSVKNGGYQNCHVTVCDINKNMMNEGKARSNRLGHNSEMISWEEGNAEQLSFKDNSFNAYTVAFGVRNVTRINKVLDEAYRVLQPGGRFMCLEFSHLENSYAQWFYDQYSFQIIPVLGQLLAGQWKPYQYLVESIKKFPDQMPQKRLLKTERIYLDENNIKQALISIFNNTYTERRASIVYGIKRSTLQHRRNKILKRLSKEQYLRLYAHNPHDW